MYSLSFISLHLKFQPWDERLRRAQDMGTLIRNLDPSYVAQELELRSIDDSLK